jgi:MoaA/NifB/PqqE/SkfB family radical SAM enzyme
MMASITDICNMDCLNCISAAGASGRNRTEEEFLRECDWKRIFREADKLGIRFFLLGGGEPFMRLDVIEAAARYKHILFLIFTNGTFRDEAYFKLLDKNRNLFMTFCLEGDRTFTDGRKGDGIYSELISYMEELNRRNIFYGASIVVTNDNLQNSLSDNFLSDLYFRGCKVVFFVEHVQLDRNSKNLALTKKERDYLSSEIQLLRLRYEDMLFFSFPGDEKNTGGCLAAGRGFFHINPYGNAEPCPFSPYSDTDLRKSTLLEALQSPFFRSLTASPMLLKENNGRCVLYEREEEVKKLCGR